MSERLFVRAPLAIFTGTGGDARGGVVVEDGCVAELVAAGAAPRRPVDQVFDASGHVVVPGLVNAHHHFYQTLTRATALNLPLFPWLEALYPVWAGLTPEQVDVATRVALAELLLSGCTLAADHHYVFNAGLGDVLAVQADAAADLGMRVLLTRGSMSLGRAAGGLPPDSVTQDEDTILADCEACVGALHDASPGAMVRIALAPCSPFSVTPRLMRDTAALARRLGVRLHTHLGETEDENAFCLDKLGCRPVEFLAEVDWLGADVWLAHGIHFEPDEIMRLGAAGVGVCHCPSSNLLLGSGQCPTLDLERAGATIGLGVDGSASNDGSNLVQEARMALLVQRLRYGPERIGHQQALRWASAGGAALLGWPEVGTLAPGRRADLALFTLDEARFSGAGDPLAALLLCGAHRADRVMVDGHWRVIDGEIPGLDLPALLARHAAAAAALRARAS